MSEPSVKLPSPKEMVVLELLAARAQMYGLEMVRASDGKLKRGTVYVLLDRMEEKGLVRSRSEEKSTNISGIPRRLYAITGLGQRALRAVESAQLAYAGVVRVWHEQLPKA